MYKKRSRINKYQHKYQCKAKNKGVCLSRVLFLHRLAAIFLYKHLSLSLSNNSTTSFLSVLFIPLALNRLAFSAFFALAVISQRSEKYLSSPFFLSFSCVSLLRGTVPCHFRSVDALHFACLIFVYAEKRKGGKKNWD